MGLMDYVFIKGLKVQGKHGVMDVERKVEQEFEIGIKMWVDTKKAAQSDHLEDAMDYAPVKDRIVEIIQTNSFYLIERLAETICTSILKDTKITKVELTIRKTAVWDNGIPGITIIRENK
jgi:FolB domain-containing protein